ncbi:MAG: bifunctional DNA primase/polymerase [Planctomycetaceae bacterium]
MRSIVFEAALRYAELGYPVFPCAQGEKLPRTVHGFKDASTDPEQITAWWTKRPAANIGIPTEGLLVLDVDVESTWLDGKPEWERDLAVAPLSITPSQGRHYVFRQPEGKHWRNTESDIAPHIDTRGDGGLFVAPPSALPAGQSYRWAPGSELDVPRERLPEPPGWLIEILDHIEAARSSGATSPSSPRDAASDAVANTIPSGQRNGTLAKLAGTMRRVGMSPGEIQAALLKANTDRCQPPLDAREVVRIAESVGRYEPDQISVALIENHWEQFVATGGDAVFRFQTITSRELNAADYRQEFLVENILVRGQPMIVAGPRKALKTNSCIDLALSLGGGGLFLGRFNIPHAVRVGMMSAESGPATIQETARRIARTKSIDLDRLENVVWSLDVPQLDNPVHVAGLQRWIQENALDVLILDPTYLMMFGIGQDAGNLFVVGRYLQVITELVRETGVTPILCHHLRKGLAEPFEPAELEDIAWAGFQEFTRQWLLLNRRSRYDPDRPGCHELWINVGGSAGHSGQYGLDVDEGTIQAPTGRHWETEILSTADAYARRNEAAQADRERQQDHAQQRRLQKHCQTLQKVLQRHPDGETMSALRRESRMNPSNFSAAIAELIEVNVAEPCDVTKGSRTFEGYRPAASDQPDQTRPNPVGRMAV